MASVCKLDFAIIATLGLALSFVVVDNYVLEGIGGVLPNSVAVLPFENLSLDPEDAFFASGIHEETLNQLMKLRDLSVISRTSVLRYQDGNLSIPEIAAELNVQTVLEGSVRYADDRVRITAQLVDGATDQRLWSDIYERDFADIFSIQADIATNIANALRAELSQAEQQSIEQAPTQSPEAYALYLRAVARMSSGDEEEIYSLGWSDDLDQAVALDPAFALAYARKAWNFAAMLTGKAPAQQAAFEHFAQENAERALQMDPTLAIAHAALGVIHQANWRWPQAEAAFERALELNPDDAAVLVGYSITQRYRGEYDEATRIGQRATEIDPGSALGYFHLGVDYRYARNHAGAARAFRTALDLAPRDNDSRAQLGYTEAARGNVPEALRELRLAEQLDGESISSTRLPQLANAYAQLDRGDEVMRLFSALEERAQATPVNEALWALAFIAIGDYERALENLRVAVEERARDLVTLGEIKANPYADPVLDEPRFRELRDRIGR